MVTSVPWQLASAKVRSESDRVVTPGQIRRGLDTPVEKRKTRT